MAMEVKVYYRKRKRGKPQPIDHIPNCFQLPRSPYASKPRTDFSLFICSSRDLEVEPRSSKEIQSSITVGYSDIPNGSIRGTVEPSSSMFTEPKCRRQDTLMSCTEVPITDVKSCGNNAHFQSCSNRNRNDEEGDSVFALDISPNRSQLIEISDVCIAPGSVIWAKADGGCWWPAEILGERSSLVQSSILHTEGRILVRYFGKNDSSWVDPSTNISPFEECFEERSCNQAEEFQNALKQALCREEHHRTCKELSGSPDRLNHGFQLPEKESSSSSSRAGTDGAARVRSKRERKRKVHFDEVSCPLYTARKVRRFKIMRSLGLAAPVGSPFNT